MTQTPFDLRTQLLDLIGRNLLGPADGPEEIVEEASVRGRYILGVLAPAGQPSLLDLEEELSEDQTGLDDAPADDSEDGAGDPAPQTVRGMMPTSIGLTFTVDGNAHAIHVAASWGRYSRRDHPDPEQVNARGEPRRVWQRKPMVGERTLPLREGTFSPWAPCPAAPGVVVRGMMRRRGGEWSVTLYLVNSQQELPARSPQGRDSAWVFQPELQVTAVDGTPIFCQRPRLPDRAEAEDLAMDMAYRHETEFAVGHGVAVHAERAPDDNRRALLIATRVMPEYEVGPTTPATAADNPDLAALVLDMQALAELDDPGLAAALSPLADAYAQWIDAQEAGATAADLAPFAGVVPQTIANMRSNLARIWAGIELIRNNPQAAEAFRFANRAMAQQRVRSQYSERRRRGQEADLAALDVPTNRSWYPFQLAFILLNLPALTDISHPERSHPTEATADLLWFPTGGGKTEAYLGLTAYTLAIRRFQGTVDDYAGHAGVAVLMRYTLRLLTLQQFQRATALICACERIRQEALAAGDTRLGVEPFRIGLWVGGSSTPNSTDDSAEALKPSGGRRSGTPYQLTTCPWCGSEIRPDRHLRVEPGPKGRGRTLMFCGDSTGNCPFTERNSRGEGIPAVVVDEEVYRLLPALLIATVDKFAQMPWKGETQMLFGRVDSYCLRHGFGSPELRCGESHQAAPPLPATRTAKIGPLRPPDLIIQDELHLISGPLGTLVGLYETAVDRLCEWEAHGHTVRPKLVASTATIRRAGDQVFQLYLRKVNVFPPPGLDARDNFFARQRTPAGDTPGRCYVGITAPGTRLKALLIRVYVAALAAAQKLYGEEGRDMDPYMTTVGYFNSMRELGSMRRAVDDAVSMRLMAANKRGLARRRLDQDSVEELTSRRSAADIPKTLDRLEWTFDENSRRGKPIDVLLATNMISVGVDVSRLGLMIVGGQPKTTAEYIQATSRVGRRYPGLVLVVYNWARPRDLSHYERFEHYHATFYKQVEPLSVTPFSPRALDRGLTGVLVALIRLAGATFNPNLGAQAITDNHPLVQEALATISRRAGLATADAEVESDTWDRLTERIDSWRAQTLGPARIGYKANRDGITLPLLKPAEAGVRDLFMCLNSLREVEPSSPLLLDDSDMAQRGVYVMRSNPSGAASGAADDTPGEEASL
jgi:hypothetical protein